MKEKIKVYLQYPWKFPDSPYYKYLIDCHPEGIEFQNTKKQKGVIINKRFFWFSNFLKRNIRKWTNNLSLEIPNAHLSPKGDYDLIHCCHCLSKNTDKPWIADIEMISSFAVSKWDTVEGQEKVKKILLDKNCKKIMPWTEHIKKEILKIYPEIKEKIEVIYPAVPIIKNLKKPKNKKLKIIFIARSFDIKGGPIALEVLDQLRQKYDIEGIIVSNVPKKLKVKYPNLKIYNLIPQEELFKLMEKSDLFLYPSSVDTFGFSLLEAMAFGLPIITINTNYTMSRKEIIKHNKTGLIFDIKEKVNYRKISRINNKAIALMFEGCSKLIENNSLRKKMSKECIKTIKEGKFSITERDIKLKRIYKEVLK